MKLPFTGLKLADRLLDLKQTPTDHMSSHKENILKNFHSAVSGIKSIKNKNTPVPFESSRKEFQKKYRVFLMTYAVAAALFSAAVYASLKISGGSSFMWDIMSLVSLAYGARLLLDCAKANAHCRLLMESWSDRERVTLNFRQFLKVIAKRPNLLAPKI